MIRFLSDLTKFVYARQKDCKELTNKKHSSYIFENLYELFIKFFFIQFGLIYAVKDIKKLNNFNFRNKLIFKTFLQFFLEDLVFICMRLFYSRQSGFLGTMTKIQGAMSGKWATGMP